MMKIKFKVVLNGDFKRIFLKKKAPFDKAYHRKLLRQSVIEMFCKLFYPLNVNLGEAQISDYYYEKIAKSGIVVYLTSEINLYDKKDVKNIEGDLRRYSIHPHFLRYAKILEIL